VSLGALNDWVLRQACRTALGWSPAPTDPVSVAVNVAPQRLLRQLLFGKLEIDPAFVQGSAAEGVEGPTQAAALAEMGCQFGQGFYWSRAVPENKVAALLSRPTWTPARRSRSRPPLR
jgi:EAL domain-containing protein (putative c-di-GMP-specific phosphodiesterase class I)